MADVEPQDPATGSERDRDQLVGFLEPAQLVLDKSRPLPRAELRSAGRLGLWALRVFVLIVSAMVIYTFFAQLG